MKSKTVVPAISGFQNQLHQRQGIVEARSQSFTRHIFRKWVVGIALAVIAMFIWRFYTGPDRLEESVAIGFVYSGEIMERKIGLPQSLSSKKGLAAWSNDSSLEADIQAGTVPPMLAIRLVLNQGADGELFEKIVFIGDKLRNRTLATIRVRGVFVDTNRRPKCCGG